MGFSENLARMQSASGETSYRLAKELGVHQSSVKNWKSGVKPHPKHIEMLATHFGCTVEELLAESGGS